MNTHNISHGLGAFGTALGGAGTVTALSGYPNKYVLIAAGVGFALSAFGKGMHAYATGNGNGNGGTVPIMVRPEDQATKTESMGIHTPSQS